MILIIVNSCNTTAGQYFNRPRYSECITLKEKGLMVCDRQVMEIPHGLTIPRNQEEFEEIRIYYMNREQSDFECKKYKRC